MEQQSTVLHNGFVVPADCELEVLPLAVKNAHPRDRLIVFQDEGHNYYIKGSSKGWTSVTTVVHELFDHFNGPMVAWRMVRSPMFPSAPKYEKYRELTVAEDGSPLPDRQIVNNILESWKANGEEAAALGTRMHRSIELYYNGVSEEEENETTEYKELFAAFARREEERGLEPYRTEWMIFSEDHHICGSVDMIMVDTKTGKLYMRDWKRSKEIKSKGYRKGKAVLQHLQDCNEVHYCLQLNMYKYILERHYGVAVEEMQIVVLHPSNAEPLVITVPDMQAEIRALIRHREQGTKVEDVFHLESGPRGLNPKKNEVFLAQAEERRRKEKAVASLPVPLGGVFLLAG